MHPRKNHKVTFERERETSLMERRLERQVEEKRLEMLNKHVQEKLNAAPAEKDKIQAA